MLGEIQWRFVAGEGGSGCLNGVGQKGPFSALHKL